MIIQGDALQVLKTLPAESVNCCITSPPYYGLRDYGIDGQIGLESTPEEYVARLVDVFREVKRVLRGDGTLWLNLGDSYAAQGGPQINGTKQVKGSQEGAWNGLSRQPADGLKPKDLIGIPWLVAFALRADGWYLRQDIIWSKNNCMPESVTDRCTKSHEYIFLLSKAERYFYDAEAIKEEAVSAAPSGNGFNGRQGGSSRCGPQSGGRGSTERWQPGAKRNKRSVWAVSTQPFKEAHFATFPEKLIEPCVLAGTSERGYCPGCGKPWTRQVKRLLSNTNEKRPDNGMPGRTGKGLTKERAGDSSSITLGWYPTCSCNLAPIPGTILDPFFGTGTTGLVAKKLGRRYIGIELNPDYIAIATKRISEQPENLELLLEASP